MAGIFEKGGISTATDFNTKIVQGKYIVYTSSLAISTNYPTGGRYGLLEVKQFDGNRIIQRWTNVDDNLIFERTTENAGTRWSKWKKISTSYIE